MEWIDTVYQRFYSLYMCTYRRLSKWLFSTLFLLIQTDYLSNFCDLYWS